jgi:lysine decarboxylase
MDKIILYRQELDGLKNIHLLNESYIGKYGIKDIDISKLTALSENIMCTEIASKLEKMGIVLEMIFPGHFTAICTPSDSDDGFKRLKDSLFEIDTDTVKNDIDIKCMPYPEMEMIYTPRDAFYMGTRKVDFSGSSGCVAGEFAIPYPPGTPVIVPGEKISKEAIDLLKIYEKNGIEIVGCSHNGLEKFCVLM